MLPLSFKAPNKKMSVGTDETNCRFCYCFLFFNLGFRALHMGPAPSMVRCGEICLYTLYGQKSGFVVLEL